MTSTWRPPHQTDFRRERQRTAGAHRIPPRFLGAADPPRRARMGDRHGRRKIFVIGTDVVRGRRSSIAEAAPPNIEVPVASACGRLQGVGAALSTPGSLAIIQASFRKERDRAPGRRRGPGSGGIAGAIGPFHRRVAGRSARAGAGRS